MRPSRNGWTKRGVSPIAGLLGRSSVSLFVRNMLDRIGSPRRGHDGDPRAIKTGVMRTNFAVAMGALNPGMQQTNDTAGWPQVMPTTILLVEDEPAVREVTREALELGGYRVLEAKGPEEATRIAADHSTAIALLLTDVVMPGMNGPELARHICESRPELITVFMTGYANSEMLRTVTGGISQHYIQKPFTVDGLLSQVADALAAQWHGNQED